MSAACTYEAAFQAGYAAFGERARPLDNPYFADAGRVELFDAWSDGWHSARDASLPVKFRLLTQLRKTPWWRRGDLRGVTATWSGAPAERSSR